MFYTIENGLALYIWLGGQVDPLFVQYLFNVQSASQIQNGNVNTSRKKEFILNLFVYFQCHIPDLDNPISKNVRTLLNNIRNERNSFMKVCIRSNKLDKCVLSLSSILVYRRSTT